MRQAVGFGLAIILAGCAGAQDESPSAATTAAIATESPEPSPTASPTAEPTPAGTPFAYTTETFQPTIEVQVPGGWTVSERDADLVQIYELCDGCPHGGEENGEISIDLILHDQSLDDVATAMQDTANLEVGAVEPVEVGELSGVRFTATRAGGPSDVRFRAIDYGSEASGDPIDVYAVELGGETAVIIVDPHQATGADADAFYELALGILESLRVVSDT